MKLRIKYGWNDMNKRQINKISIIMKTIMLLFKFKPRYIAILLSLSILIFSLSGCATAPLYSNAKIPNENLNDKYKVAIKKENIVFTSGSFLSKDSLSGKQVAIYNCLGKEIYDRIPGVGVFMVDKRPANPNIIYIHNYSNEKTWWIPNAGDVTAMAFGLLGDMIGKEPNRAVFTADVLINGKNYPIKADGTVIQPILSLNANKILKKVCGNFERKFINLLLVEKTPQTSPIGDSEINSYLKKIALHVYKTNSPFMFAYQKSNYNAIPIASTLSGCKIISVIRQRDYSNLKPLKVKNYKIRKGKISEIKNSNMAKWDALQEEIKPIVNKVIKETREYGKASANYNGYTVIGKANVSGKSVRIYILKGIQLEAILKK